MMPIERDRCCFTFDPARYGGALYDLNVYNMDFAPGPFWADRRRPVTIQPGLERGGYFRSAGAEYPECRAELTAAKDSDSPCFLQVQGEKGWLRVEGNPSTWRA